MDSIKRVRKARGVSLAELAAKTGLLGPALARAEREGTDAKASTVSLIAKALGVPVCELFEESGHGRQRRKRKAKQ